MPAAGFGMGIDRVALLHEAIVARSWPNAEVYVALAGDHQAQASAVAERIRDATALRVLQHAGSGGLRSQLAEADRSGARWAVIVGDEEAASNRVSLKWLREDRPQTQMDVPTAIETLTGG